ncbi:NACHT, LRR and PYD domains-containing protein 12-like isoform X2 [Triplophysa rosa]|uniref:NACHT n=1 Tax=Triplophysa rosa TaxID=992332 RepID=A0A9W8C3A6_TRIRA|nr:NACHT, LRR and PYD domains-containing protein 12-like isoform X2 [Triplophysa rosa]KAI7806114.1 putative NACHT [Triplophysa rosa]
MAAFGGQGGAKSIPEEDIHRELTNQERSDSPTSQLTLRSEKSIPQPINFSNEAQTTVERNIQERKRSDSPTPSHESLTSDKSIPQPINFSSEAQRTIKRTKQKRSDSPTPSHESLKSAKSIPQPNNLSSEGQTSLESELSERITWKQAESRPTPGVCQQHHRTLEVFCRTDKIDICSICAGQEHHGHSKLYSAVSYVSDSQYLLHRVLGNMQTQDFKTFKRDLSEQYPGCLGSHPEELNASGVAEKIVESFGGEGAWRITFHFLENANPLQKITEANKVNLKHKCQQINEGNSSHAKQSLLNEIYTDLYITEGRSGEINTEHEVIRNEVISQSRTTPETPQACNDIFKTLPGQRKQVRTVLMMGIVGIGKNVTVKKFMLDWADGKANQDIEIVIHLPFQDLNRRKGNCSLQQLIHQYAPELKEANLFKLKVLFILDGLDVCQYPLDFHNNDHCSDINEQTSVDVLLTNLIRGNLLPSALLWITTRPSSANRIPPECVHRVTEIRGFNDHQKEEYFRKKIKDQKQASEIITHIKSCRSLYIMCHMPIFCWISATVLENMLSNGNSDKKPKTLTEMFTHFLLIQISLKHKKFNGTNTENPKKLSESDTTLILKLGELAFQQLQKESSTFIEDDLKNCGIDVSKVSQYSMCTEIFREELGLYREKIYSFVHLILQEYLAALYAHFACVNDGKNILVQNRPKSSLSAVHQSAVNTALKRENGHLDLFLRFFMGLSVEPNHTLLQAFRKGGLSESCANKNMIDYLQEKIKQEAAPERIINIFHCLNELNDNSLVKTVQSAMKSGTLLGSELDSEQWSALAYVLLTSGEELEEFDMKKFHTSTANQLRLLPVLKICKIARLDCCNLSFESCKRVALAFQIENSHLRELILTNNKLNKSGVNFIISGLCSPHCRLQKLSLAGCSFPSESCKNLATVLISTNSSLRELNLSYNRISDDGVNDLCTGLMSPNCRLKILKLKCCDLTESCCEKLASVLTLSHLIDLQLKCNDLQDSGVEKLSVGLAAPQCKIERLGLSGCMITEKGCSSLALALNSNPDHLRDLDLSYNHPGDSEIKLCTAKQHDPDFELDLRNGGECRMKPGLKKYACQFTVDPRLIHRRLLLSEDNLSVSESRTEQPYPDNPNRYRLYPQALCKEPIRERCYFELECKGGVAMGVAYKSPDRTQTIMGVNNKFPSLHCLNDKLTLWQNNESTCEFPVSARSTRIAVYVDWAAGSLTYYSIHNDTLIHLHTHHTTFTDELYAGFFLMPDSSVTLWKGPLSE